MIRRWKAMYRDGTSADRRRIVLSGAAIVLFLAAVAALTVIVGRPLVRFLGEPAAFRDWVGARGAWGRIAFLGMIMVQLIIAVIPGEPFEIAAGYAFGIWEGTLLCMIGTTLGSILVFLFVRKLGTRAVETFFPLEKLNEVRFLKSSKNRNTLAFLLFLIPGTPKDLLTYCVGLTDMKLSTWVFITFFARIPSIVTSTIGGDALGLENYWFAVIVFAVSLVISGIGILIYRRIGNHTEEADMEEKTNVMRILDQRKVGYRAYYYDSQTVLSGTEVATALGLDPTRVFKTLVTQAKSGRYYVFMIPAAAELDLKKAAMAVREKAVEMLKAKELLPLTGYVHGGCSPVGMKKRLPTVIDSTAADAEALVCSAGRIGAQVELSVKDLQQVTGAVLADLTV